MLLQPGRCPRHKLRVYGQSQTSRFGESGDYKRLLNFLSKSVGKSERQLLSEPKVPDFAQVKELINRRTNRPSLWRSAEGFDQALHYFQGEVRHTHSEKTMPPAKQDNTGGDEAQFISHLSELLNAWFDQENLEDEESDEMRLLDKHVQARRLLAKFSENARTDEKLTNGPTGKTTSGPAPLPKRSKELSSVCSEAPLPEIARSVPKVKTSSPDTTRLANGTRREIYKNGSIVDKDAIGRVMEVHSPDGARISFSYDQKGHLQKFVRSDWRGKIDSTGERDKHGVVVRDANGRVRAQGDSMYVDSNGCVSIRKFDGQFWSLDIVRGIHVERRILEDVNGEWNCLTALLTCDGFRMVTRFQKLKERNRQDYRRFGDWLHAKESTFRFYGRDGSMVQFNKDEDLQALKPSEIWPPGSRKVEREWRLNHCPVGRQAGTAWESVHQYISQYLAAL